MQFARITFWVCVYKLSIEGMSNGDRKLLIPYIGGNYEFKRNINFSNWTP
jgi:hypothetical protein